MEARAQPPLLPLDSVSAFLDEHRLGSGPVRARRIGEGGGSNFTFLLERDDATYPQSFSSQYALSKKLAEELVLEAQSKLELIVLRPKAIYGPGDRALLPRIVAAARARRLPQIGDGENLIDLTFVDDAVQAITCSLEGLKTSMRPDPSEEVHVPST